MKGSKTRRARMEEQKEAAALATAFAGASKTERDRLARIVDLLPCYVVLIDKAHAIHFYNKAFTQYFGDVGHVSCHKALRGLDGPCRFCPPLDVINSRSTCVMEWVHPQTRHAFRVYSYPFKEPGGGSFVLKVGFNITSSMRVQQALDLSEQSYRAITDNLAIGIALLDPNLRIKAGNSRLGQWFGQGFQPERHICDMLQCPGLREGADDAADVDNAGGASCSGEGVDLSSLFAEAARNKAGEQASGQSPEAAPKHAAGRDAHGAGADLSSLSSEHVFCDGCPFHLALADGASHEKEFAVTLQDGGERMMRLVACPVKPSKGNGKTTVHALIMMLEDITTRLRVNQQLQRARKLEAMGTLAGGIAHEINQPLSALHLYASGLQMLMEKQDKVPPEVTQERLTLIMREAEKIRSIIAHMRTLVMREGAVPVGPVAVLEVVKSALGIMRHQFATRKIEVRVNVSAHLPQVRSNGVQLEQVLVNLLGNAVHALDSDAAQSPEKRSRCITIKAAANEEGSRVRIEVADSGPGLPKGSDRIFDPFYTTKERHEGMGLGLSIVHGLVRLWGGEVSALPRHPQLGGAAFYVELDIARPLPEDAPPDSELQPSGE